jgi:hypothetical protein
VALGWVAFSGCGRSVRTEARAFLQALNTIDINAPIEQRRPQIARLRALQVHHPEVKEALNRCLAAHDALLMAEEEQQRVQYRLDNALKGTQAKSFSAEEASRLNTMIMRSDENVVRARTLFPGCNTSVRSLTLRYEKRS